MICTSSALSSLREPEGRPRSGEVSSKLPVLFSGEKEGVFPVGVTPGSL